MAAAAIIGLSIPNAAKGIPFIIRGGRSPPRAGSVVVLPAATVCQQIFLGKANC